MTDELNTLLTALNGIVTVGVALRAILIFQNGRAANKSLQEILQEVGRVIYAGIIAVSISSFSSWAGSKLSVLQNVSGASKMAGVITEFIRIVRDTMVIIAGSITTWKFSKELIMYQFGDEADKAVHLKDAKKQLAAGIGIIVVGSLATVILNYFE